MTIKQQGQITENLFFNFYAVYCCLAIQANFVCFTQSHILHLSPFSVCLLLQYTAQKKAK